MIRDLAIDLGTANTLVYARGQGIVLNEPSVVAVNTSTGRVISVGTDAKLLIGRTPSHIRAVRPLKDGVVTHLGMTEKMLQYFIHKVRGRSFPPRPRVLVCVPSGITEVEQQAVKQATKAAGGRAAFLIEEPMAAAIGAGLPIQEAGGTMIVDIGGGTTEVAIISYGGIVMCTSIRIGGDELDDAIIHEVKKQLSVALGERTAEEIKIALGSAFPSPEPRTTEAKGRDLVSGLPRSIELDAELVRAAIEEPVNAIVDAVRETLDRCPPELAGDLMTRGIVLAGGGALLGGLAERIRHETGMGVHIADDPLSCVVRGAGTCLEHFQNLKPILMSSSRNGIADV
jgi:rod shape-determining protein MreB